MRKILIIKPHPSLPVMRPVAYRIPNDGKSLTLACCTLEVLEDYGIELGWVIGWNSDNCNGARAVSICPTRVVTLSSRSVHLQEVAATIACHPNPNAFFDKGCDDHQCQLCLTNPIAAGWGKKKGMGHPHPLELLYKFNHLITNSDWATIQCV